MPPEISQIFQLQCSSCRTPLGADLCNSPEPVRCPACNVLLRAEIFPAILKTKEQSGGVGKDISDGDASCFYHPEKQAVKVCSSCGRFLCSLCEIELAGRCICPVCLEEGRQKEEIAELIPKRTLHDSIALGIAALPVLFFPVTILTAPVALFLSINGWKKPSSILPRTRFRLFAALVLSGLQIAGWITLAFSVFR